MGGVGGESGEGGGGWAWTGAGKTLLFMAEAVGAVRAVRAVWAVRAALLFMAGALEGGASASGG